MRDTNQRMRLNGWFLVSICGLMLLLVLGGCESTSAGGSEEGSESNLGGTSGSDSPGEALELPAGNITSWTLGTRDDVVVVLVDASADPVKGYGPVTVQANGDFPGMSIDPPPPEALLSWTDFQWVYCYELHSIPVSITDDSVRFQSFCCLELLYSDELIIRGSGDGTVAVSWIYADGSTRISATFNTGDYDVTIDLQLAAGWNLAVINSDDINKVVTLKTEPEPAGTGLFLN